LSARQGCLALTVLERKIPPATYGVTSWPLMARQVAIYGVTG